MTEQRGTMTTNPARIVHNARMLNWSVDMLTSAFNDMSTDVARELLNGTLEINEHGNLYDPKEA